MDKLPLTASDGCYIRAVNCTAKIILPREAIRNTPAARELVARHFATEIGSATKLLDAGRCKA
jgi:trehalose-6-phosphatase